MIVGTAGHIDHGKTTLVRALTGVDTDRLAEEKARGISIELGYAYAPADDGATLGFIDVPGHERLVHTMLAGACGIDFALLVVAVDDGVMPQTREHVAILDLLGVACGAVALSKADRTDHARQAEVEHEVRLLLAPTRLAGAPLVAVNGTDPADPGVARLARLLRAAATGLPARRADGLFRLAVDRAFTLAGHGTVVTGTAFAGRVETGATLELLPAGVAVRVRGIRSQNRVADAGCAGERCALNLAGIEPAAIRRGDWLAVPGTLLPTIRIDARFTLLGSEPEPLGGYAPVHVHFGAAHATAHLLPLAGERLVPGESAHAQLVFDRPVCGAPGERFIVRDASARRTIGGGVLLDPRAPARRRRSAARRAWLAALEQALERADAAPLLAVAPWGLSRAELRLATAAPLAALTLPDGTRRIRTGADDDEFLVAEVHWRCAADAALAALAAFHAAHPAEPGPDVARLRRIVAPLAPERLWRALVEELVASGRIRRAGAWLQLPAHALELNARDRELIDKLLPLCAAGRLDPPWVRELGRSSGEPEARVRQVLAAVGREGRVCAVVPDLYYAREVVDELAAIVASLATEAEGATAARFRDRLGVGRKRAIQILEFFDRVGYTRRLGERHVLRPGSGWRGSR